MSCIGINALCYTGHKAGISIYLYNLLNQYNKKLAKKIIVFIPSRYKSDFSQFNNLRFIGLPIKNLAFRIIIEQFVIPVLFISYNIKKLHSVGNVAPLILGKRNIVTVHDIYFIHDPKRFSFLKNIYLLIFVRKSIKISEHIITVSNETKLDILKKYDPGIEKISVIYEGYTKSEPVKKLTNIGIKSQYFLFVGTIEPGKNIEGLLKGFAPLGKKYELVIVGKKGWGYQKIPEIIRSHCIENSVIFTGYVSDSVLATLYKNSISLILPSFHEGFGLPIIEAMSYGCPVCCSNTSCFPEIAADAALYFDPYKPDDICRCLKRVTEQSIRGKLIKNGYENVKRFSWERCAEKTIEVYKTNCF